MSYAFPLAATSVLRPLDQSDLYKNSIDWNPRAMASNFLADFHEQCRLASVFNRRLKSGQYQPAVFRRTFWKLRYKLTGIGSPDGLQSPNLGLAIYRTIAKPFWYGVLLAISFWVSGAILPILLKYLIDYLTEAHNASTGIGNAPFLGRGIGLTIAIILTLAIGVFCK